jgi:hypothetical protein
LVNDPAFLPNLVLPKGNSAKKLGSPAILLGNAAMEKVKSPAKLGNCLTILADAAVEKANGKTQLVNFSMPSVKGVSILTNFETRACPALLASRVERWRRQTPLPT